MAKGKNYKLFDIRTVEVQNKDTGKKEMKAKVQFPKNVTILVDGEKVDLGEYKSVFLKKASEVVENLQDAVENRGLSEEYAQSQITFIEEKNISSICELYVKGK